MRSLALLSLVLMPACVAAPDAQAKAIAIRLIAEGGGKDLPMQQQVAYAECGTAMLKKLPVERLNLAMRAKDSPAIWAALGSDALDRYVTECRKAEAK